MKISVDLRRCSKKRAPVPMVLFAIAFGALFSLVASADPAAIKVSASDFACISQMTPVRGFFVGNIEGDLAASLKVARAPKGAEYPVGTLIQLIPTEAMVKQPAGTRPATRDWEFFELEVSKSGSRIARRGFEDLAGSDGANCFGCHSLARPDWAMICESEHGCAPIPETRAMFEALQRTDPRCKNAGVVSEADREALAALDELEKKDAAANATK
jgi:hypothetical protein